MRYLTSVVLLVLAACGGKADPDPAPAPQVFDPTGFYEFTAEVEGQQVPGTLEITGSPGDYRGALTIQIGAEISVTSVTVQGTLMTLLLATPDGEATVEATFEGDIFTGRWMLGQQSGPIRGRRRR